MQWKCKGAFSERLEKGPLLSFSSIIHKIAEIDYTGVVQLSKPATSVVLCMFFLFVVLVNLLCFQEIFLTHNPSHTHYLSASESKPCSQPCGPSNAQVSVQPHAPSGKGSSSSLSPASVTEDVFFGSTNDDQVKLLC